MGSFNLNSQLTDGGIWLHINRRTPLIPVGSDFYFLSRTSGGTATELVIFKATGSPEKTSAWTIQDYANSPTPGDGVIPAGSDPWAELQWCVDASGVIHISLASMYVTNPWHVYYQFDTTTNTWSGGAYLYSELTFTTVMYETSSTGGGIVLVGEGTPLTNMGTDYRRAAYQHRSTSGTWTLDNYIGLGTTKTTTSEVIGRGAYNPSTNTVAVEYYLGNSGSLLRHLFVGVDESFSEFTRTTTTTAYNTVKVKRDGASTFDQIFQLGYTDTTYYRYPDFDGTTVSTITSATQNGCLCEDFLEDSYIYRIHANTTVVGIRLLNAATPGSWSSSETLGTWSSANAANQGDFPARFIDNGTPKFFVYQKTLTGDHFAIFDDPWSGGTTYNRTAAIAGASTVAANRTYTANRAAAMAGASVFAAVKNLIRYRTAAMAGTSTLAVVAAVEKNRTAAIAGVSAFAAVFVRTYARAAAVASNSTVAAAYTMTRSRAAAVVGVSAFTAARTVTRPAAATIAGASTVAATYGVTKNRTATIAGSSTVTALAEKTSHRTAAIAGVSTVAAIGLRTVPRSAAIASASTVTAAYTVVTLINRTATVAAASTMAVAAQVTRSRTAAVAGVSALSVTATRTYARAAAINSGSTVTVAAQVTRNRSAAVASESTLAVIANKTVNRTAAIAAVSTLTALNLDGFRWDSNTVVNATLSNENLTASIGTNDAWAFVRETKTTGKFYFEMVLDTYTSGVSSAMLGVATSDDTADLGFYLSDTNYSVGLFGSSGTLGLNDANYSPSHGEHTQGDVICFAIDYDNQLLWWRRNNGDWWGSAAGAANPVAGTDGYDFSTITTTTEYWLATYIYEAQFTAHLTPGAMTYSAPSGFIAYSTTQTDRTAAIAGVSTLAVVGQRIVSRTAAVVSASTLAVSAQVTRDRAATIAGASTLAATKQVTRTRTAAVSAASTVTVSANVQRTAAAAIDGVSGVTAAAAVTRTRAASIAAATTFTAVGGTTKPRTAAVAGVSTVTAVAQTTHRVSATIAAVSSVAALAEVAGNFSRTAQIDAVSTVAAVAEKTSNRSATVSAVSTMVAAGSVNNEFPRSAQIDAASTVTVNREVIRGAAANINAATTVTASGQRIVTRAAAVAGASNVVVLAQKRIDRAFAAAGASSMAALGVRMLLRNAVMTATSTVIATRTSTGTSGASASYTGVENGILLVVEYNKIEVQQDANGIVIGS